MAEDTQEPQADDQAQQDALPENRVDVEDAGTLKKKVTVTIPRARIDAKMDEMFGELREQAQIPGFRVGHAPRRLIEKRFGKEVGEDVRNALVGESIGDAIEKAELKTLGEPDIDLDKIELPESGDMSFSFEVEVAPEFELPELKSVPVEKPAMEVTDERVDEYLNQMVQSQASYQAADEPAEKGDAVTVDAAISGEGLETVTREDVELRVAAGQVEGIPLLNLPDELEGKSAGDTVEVTATVPDAHPNEDWQGKEVTIELTVKQVRKRSLPEINDEFAISMGFDSLKELREFMARQMEHRLENEVQRNMRDQVCQYLLDNTDFEVPEGVAKRHSAHVLQRRYVDLLYQGVPREQIDENLAQLQAEATRQAERDLKLSFILSKVAEQEGIEVDEAEVNARIAQMAASYGRRPERLRQELESEGNLQQVYENLQEEKALDKLLDEATVTEVSEEELRKRQKESDKDSGGKKAASEKKTAKKSAKKKTSAKSKSSSDDKKSTGAKKSAKKSSKKSKKKDDK
ncbi:MAG: trigger factor [Phycisphaerae bacterium]